MDYKHFPKEVRKKIECLIDNSPNNQVECYRGEGITLDKLKRVELGQSFSEILNKPCDVVNISYDSNQAYTYVHRDDKPVRVFYDIEPSKNVGSYGISDWPDEKEGFIRADDKVLDSVDYTNNGVFIFYIKNKE